MKEIFSVEFVCWSDDQYTKTEYYDTLGAAKRAADEFNNSCTAGAFSYENEDCDGAGVYDSKNQFIYGVDVLDD